MIRLPVLDAGQAAAWDARAREAAGIPSRVLMEAAGRAVAQALARAYQAVLRRGVLVAAGHGNNGGDGWVAARALRSLGVRVSVAETGGERAPDCDANRALALADGVELVADDASWPTAGVVIDALLGTGATGPPRGPAAALAAHIAAQPGPVVAVDGPTGLDLSSGRAYGPVRATLTVTFGGLRRGHLLAREWCGRVVVADIGFPEPDPAWPWLAHEAWARTVLPPITATMHKGDRGRVLVVGGADGMSGAALHAVSAAFGAGAGLVKLAAHDATVRAAQATLPDALSLTTALGPDLEPALVDALDWGDAVILGPGMGRGADRTQFVTALFARAQVPVIVDADALHAGLDALAAGEAPRVLTPHVGEFRAAFPEVAERLGHDRFAAAAAAADALAGRLDAPLAVLLKGVPTVIASPGRALAVGATGNPALATGGSGDLLSGFIGCYLARGLHPQAAGALGAFTLGRAAEIAAARYTVRSTRPADVLAAVPDLWRLLAAPAAVQPPTLLELDLPAVT